MFDIAFSELLLIGVVALVVIGPERLPKVARTMGHLFGRLQRYVTQVKSDINREMDLAEFKSAKTEFENAARSFQGDIETTAASTEREIRDVQAQIDRELASSSAPDNFPKELIREPDPAGEVDTVPARGTAQMELGIEDAYPPDASKPKSAG